MFSSLSTHHACASWYCDSKQGNKTCWWRLVASGRSQAYARPLWRTRKCHSSKNCWTIKPTVTSSTWKRLKQVRTSHQQKPSDMWHYLGCVEVAPNNCWTGMSFECNKLWICTAHIMYWSWSLASQQCHKMPGTNYVCRVSYYVGLPLQYWNSALYSSGDNGSTRPLLEWPRMREFNGPAHQSLRGCLTFKAKQWMVPKQSTIYNALIEAIYPPPYNHLHSSIHLSICMYVFLVSYALGSQLFNPWSSHASSRCACSTEHHIAWNMPAHLYINILYNGNLAQSTIFHPVLQYSNIVQWSWFNNDTFKSKIALCVRVLRYKNPPVRDIHTQRTHPNVKFQAKLGTVTSSSIACFGERDMAGNCSCPYSASYLLSLKKAAFYTGPGFHPIHVFNKSNKWRSKDSL